MNCANHTCNVCPGDKKAAIFPTVIRTCVMEILAIATSTIISYDS